MQVHAKRYKLIDVAKIDKAPWNYKDPDSRLVEQLHGSLEMHGQVQSILVRQKNNGRYEVCDGNHRIDEFRANEVTHAFAYDAGRISVERAIELSFILNDGHHPSNDFLKAKALKRLLAKDADAVNRLPYTPEYLATLAAIAIPPESGGGSATAPGTDTTTMTIEVSKEFLDGVWSEVLEHTTPDENMSVARHNGLAIENVCSVYLGCCGSH